MHAALALVLEIRVFNIPDHCVINLPAAALAVPGLSSFSHFKFVKAHLQSGVLQIPAHPGS